MLRYYSDSASSEVPLPLPQLPAGRGGLGAMGWQGRTLQHRRGGGLQSLWYAAVSCLLFFLVGNLLMFHSYQGLVDSQDGGAAGGHVHGQGGPSRRGGWRGEDPSLHRSPRGSPQRGQQQQQQQQQQQDSDAVIRELAEQFLGTSLLEPRPNHYSVFDSRQRRLLEKPGGEGEDAHPHANGPPGGGGAPPPPLLDCGDIVGIGDREYVASGWTKAVYRGRLVGRGLLALKTVDLDGQDMNSCLDQGGSTQSCYWRAAQKIMKEIVVLQALPHPNVLKVLGFCVPRKQFDGDSSTSVVMVTELGDTIDLIKLLQLSWEDRLRISQGLAHLLQHLASTPYGAVAMNDFRRQQFVLVGGDLKLSDVDDVGFGDPPCTQHWDCTVRFSSANFTKRLPCMAGRCAGYNEQRNIFNAGRHFTSFLLPHGAPPSLRPLIDRVVSAFSSLTLTSAQLAQHLDRLVELYRSGQYLNRSSSGPRDQHRAGGYKELRGQDLPGQHDYRCRLSLSGTGCTLSVFDQQEAQDVCDLDPECRAFVLTRQQTWAGRWIVHLKNGTGPPSPNPDMRLFLRPS